MKRLLPLLILTVLPQLLLAQTAAEYTITFTSNWSQQAHPHSSGSLPGGAHWSRLVGATHNDQGLFLEMGQLASQGIENIAETGSNTVFFQEVDDAITAGWADRAINGPDLDSSLGQIQITELVVSPDFPMLTLASMIAPSPDWMIAVSGLSLQDEQGDWLEEVQMDLYAYDAGTDSGPDYTSPNMDTDPAEPISSLQAVTPFSNEIIGTLRVELTNILNVESNLLENVRIAPNPVTDRLSIQGGNWQKLELYNSLGSMITTVQTKDQQANIQMDNYPAGLYLLRLIGPNNQVSTHKIIKR